LSEKIIKEIQSKLKDSAPQLTKEQIMRRYKVLNSKNPNFFGYGHKMVLLEKLARTIQQNLECDYKVALDVFQSLMNSNIHEEKFMAVLFLNRFKKDFDEKIIELFLETFSENCDTWALCDSSMIKILGPFLAKEQNETLALETIKKWANHENMWIRRASMVILLKIIMIKKTFDPPFVFDIIENIFNSAGEPEQYIHKGIGWLLKTCSRYDQGSIIAYLKKNKDVFPRLILRYASEKLPKEIQKKILQKSTSKRSHP